MPVTRFVRTGAREEKREELFSRPNDRRELHDDATSFIDVISLFSFSSAASDYYRCVSLTDVGFFRIRYPSWKIGWRIVLIFNVYQFNLKNFIEAWHERNGQVEF